MRALDVMDDWCGAYEAAKGEPAPDISWQGGEWFHVYYPRLTIRHRRDALEAMTARLRAAAEQREKQK